MKIDRKLNLVLPIDRGDGKISYVHSVPIGREVFERYYSVIAQTFTEIYRGGYSVQSGPFVSYLILRDIAIKNGLWEGDEGVDRGLVAEMMRLSNTIVPGDTGGWKVVPFQDAVDTGYFDEDDLAEVQSLLVFFMVESATRRKKERQASYSMMAELWDVRTTSLNCTGFATSLPTSTPAENFGEKAKPSSIPS